MTDERKQELRQLLQEAMNNLVIRVRFESGTISKEKYIEILRKRCEFYGISDDSLNNYYLLYQPDIAHEKTKADLLEFIRRELNQVIEDNKIGYTTYNVDGCAQDGFCLVKRIIPQTHNLSDISDILEYLLNMSLAFGLDKTVLSFNQDSCPEGRYSLYHSITSLEGIRIETEIQINKRVRLVPLPRNIEYKLNHSLYNRHRRHRDKGTTLLIIEGIRYALFHKPSDTNFADGQIVNLPFQVEDDDVKLSNQGMIMDFRETFCAALSLACNTMVMFDYFWEFSTVDVFRSDDVERKIWYLGPIGRKVEVGQSEIEEAIRLYKILEIFDQKAMGPHDQKAKGIFWIASERWRKSKTHQNSEDKIIDLCIAFESLYLSGINDELKFRLSVRAAWFLGKNKDDQKRLLTVFKKIYDCRSTIIHGGELRKRTVTIDNKTIPVSELITEAQDLCQKSIVKILKKYSEDGKYPDDNFWNNLILG